MFFGAVVLFACLKCSWFAAFCSMFLLVLVELLFYQRVLSWLSQLQRYVSAFVTFWALFCCFFSKCVTFCFAHQLWNSFLVERREKKLVCPTVEIAICKLCSERYVTIGRLSESRWYISAPSGKKKRARVNAMGDSTYRVDWKPVEAGRFFAGWNRTEVDTKVDMFDWISIDWRSIDRRILKVNLSVAGWALWTKFRVGPAPVLLDEKRRFALAGYARMMNIYQRSNEARRKASEFLCGTDR